ncbi:hypothetical protein J2X03_002396 [Microbacterium trichothecenolyticum]|nr:hypothetical protein [Microbacterium trichothecenolyticum]
MIVIASAGLAGLPVGSEGVATAVGACVAVPTVGAGVEVTLGEEMVETGDGIVRACLS